MHALAWVIYAMVFGLVEAATSGFFMLFFAVGALAAALSALVYPDLQPQLVVFVITSLSLLLIGRPILQKTLGLPQAPQPSNVQSLIGQTVIVLDTVTAHSGRVKVADSGEVWSAYHTGQQPIAVGLEAQIIQVNGAKLVVQAKS